MSDFLDKARALIERIVNGNMETPKIKEDIEELKNSLAENMKSDQENKASDEEVKTILLEILEKLAVLQPPQS